MIANPRKTRNSHLIDTQPVLRYVHCVFNKKVIIIIILTISIYAHTQNDILRVRV